MDKRARRENRQSLALLPVRKDVWMDFGKILDTWDKKDAEGGSGRKNMQKWLDTHGVEDKDTFPAPPSKGKKEKILAGYFH